MAFTANQMNGAAASSLQDTRQTECRTNRSMRLIVRDATVNEHRLIDGALSALDLADKDDYIRFLRVHYTALNRLAKLWSRQDHLDFFALSSCAAEDLETLQEQAVRPLETIRLRMDPLYQCGIAYVVRGSRLGATISRQRVPACYPTSFLDYEMSFAWPTFVNKLDDCHPESSLSANAQVIRGAKHAFATFAQAADRASL